MFVSSLPLENFETDRNYRGIKLLEYVMKVLEHVPESLIRSQDDINNM